MPVSSGCVPVNKLGIKGMTCWCKTNLCNGDVIPNEQLDQKQSDIEHINRAESRLQEPEF